ncbi:MAG TPA: hypothetical protein VFW49_08100 [Fluviicoccus sp.]|nr:hypothetical protein [Fluviicoccus sp.]
MADAMISTRRLGELHALSDVMHQSILPDVSSTIISVGALLAVADAVCT